jgi:oxaloacetate decarboxylase alpha subunit
MKVFEHQVPGGMISNLVSQLEEQKASDRLDEVLEEIPRVRKDMGYPPLVTPTSQIIGIQAVLNVLMGEKYKLCPGEVKDYVRGLYGRPAVPISKEIKEKIIGSEKVITGRPADLLEPGWEKGKQEISNITDNDEDILTYILFPQVALKFFDYRQNRDAEDIPQILSKDEVGEELKQEEAVTKPIPRIKKRLVHGEDDDMKIDEIRELILLLDQTSLTELEVQNQDYRLSLRKSTGAGREVTPSSDSVVFPTTKEEEPEVEDNENIVEVTSPMVGTFYQAPSPDAGPFVQVGDHVEPGQTLCIIEAMKLMNEIKAEFAGTVVAIAVDNSEPVEFGQVLFLLERN